MAQSILLLYSAAHAKSVYRFKECAVGLRVVPMQVTSNLTAYDAVLKARASHCSAVVLYDPRIIAQSLLMQSLEVSAYNYAGSFYKYKELDWLVIEPINALSRSSASKFLTKHYLTKISQPHEWFKSPEFNQIIYSPELVEEFFDFLNGSKLVGVDIETNKEIEITHCSFAGVQALPGGGYICKSMSVPLNSEFEYYVIKRFNEDVKAPKVFQNGKYDINYLMRFGICPYRWSFDTAVAFHSWYSELPKDLGALGAFFIKDIVYWKDLAKTTSESEYQKYNAMDSWATAVSMLAWLLKAPQFARTNYSMEFPVNYGNLVSELTGLHRDLDKLAAVRAELLNTLAAKEAMLAVMVGVPGFNSGSEPQKAKLLKIWGCADIYKRYGTDQTALSKCALKHPMFARIVGVIKEVQKLKKLLSTYLKESDHFAKNRILYAISTHTTDTGRQSSKKHHFWCGMQVQNIPRGKLVKQTIVAPEDYVFGEADYAQAEARDVAFLAGDENLIAAVTGENDFHATNCSAFFGIPYAEIYDNATRKTVNSELRDLSKRVNHGANYNMQEQMLLDTMGDDKVDKAQKLLNLDPSWSRLQVCSYLLSRFDKTYPVVRGPYYRKIINAVVTTKLLVGPTGWTRYCFGDPEHNREDKNSYVAHPSQNLNAMTLNKAWIAIFNFWRKHYLNFKLLAQIHDSVFYARRTSETWIDAEIKNLMEFDVPVTDIKGITRILRVPVDVNSGKTRWSELK